MSGIRILITTFIAACVLSTATIAQAPRKDKAQGGAGMAIVKQLGLSQDQRSQIGDIVKKFHADAKVILQSSAGKDEKKTQIASLRQSAAAAINALLTPEQLEKANQIGLTDKLLRANERAKTMMKVLAQLNLTDAQKTEIKGIMQDTRAKVQALNNDSTLTPDAKKSQIKTLREEAKQKITSLLTTEQQSKLQEIMSSRKAEKGRNNK